MALLTSVSPSHARCRMAGSRARAGRGALAGLPLDPVSVLQVLAAESRSAAGALAATRCASREVESLLLCARELAILVEACDGGAIEARATRVTTPALALAFMVGRYRAALEMPLPRALREALRAQLARLEGETEGAARMARAA